MIKVLFATGNETKAKRFSKGLQEKGIRVISLKDITTEREVEENGKDAIENALIKARAYSKIINIPVFAMDDNLYLENVPKEKQPGMYVRRVNGKRLNDHAYTWSKEDFYMVDKPSNKINPGYPLNTISINKKLNKYFTDITEEDKLMLQEDESDVIEFIANSVID